MSKKVPWDKIEEEYKKKLSDKNIGAPAKPLRMALGALIIKEKLQISDREVVEQIRETPYLQYFIGLEGYEDKEPFDSSMMVHFRKRLDGQLIQKTNATDRAPRKAFDWNTTLFESPNILKARLRRKE